VNTDLVPALDAFAVRRLGPCRYASPLGLSSTPGDFIPDYTADGARVLVEVEYTDGAPPRVAGFERAGARRQLFFDPAAARAGIVTCGGLCPGLNSVIMAICKSLFELYGAARVVGFQGGYGGIYSRPVRELTLANTTGIQNRGGTILTSARGGFDSGKILAKLE
jgi:6-phosphofructokinase 1